MIVSNFDVLDTPSASWRQHAAEQYSETRYEATAF